MAGTIKQQIQARQPNVRASRTERVMQKQAQNRSVQNFETLKQRAEQIRSGMVDKPNDPFTFEDYQAEYNRLSPELKQFFASPNEILSEKDKVIQAERDKVTQKINEWQNYIDEKKANIERLREKLQTIKSPSTRKNYKEAIKEREKAIEEYQKKIRNLSKELGRIAQGYDAGSLIDYAQEKTRYLIGKKEQQQKAETEALKNVSSKTKIPIINKGKVVGFADIKEGETAEDYYKKFGGSEVVTIKGQNISGIKSANIPYAKSLEAWSSKVGYEKLPEFAKKIVNPSAYEWQQKNPDEKLVFDNKGSVIAVDSKALGNRVTINDYNKKIEEYNKKVELENSPDYQYQKYLEERGQKQGMTTFYPNMVIDADKIPNTNKYLPVNKDYIGTINKIESESVKKGVWQDIKSFVKEEWNKPIKMRIISSTLGGKGILGQEFELETTTKELQKKAEQKSQQGFEKYITDMGIKQELEAKFQGEYQARFENKYMKDIIYGKIDFETAKKEFEKSADATIVAQRYDKELEKRLKGMPINKDVWKTTGYKFLGKAVSLYPSTQGKAIKTGAIVGGTYLFGAYAPTILSTGVTVGFTAVQLEKAISKKLSPFERAGNIVGAGVGLALLSYQATRYLRLGTVKYKKIPLKDSLTPKGQRGYVKQVVTRPIKNVYGEDVGTLDIYKAKKFSEQTVFGKRAIVSTKWRDLLRLKPIYEGVPYKQLGKRYVMRYQNNLRFRTESGYDKAIDILVKRNKLTLNQARQAIKYYQPVRQFEIYQGEIAVLSGGQLKNPIYVTKGTKLITRPSQILDKELGIKTRGGTAIKEYISGRGEMLGEFKGQTLYKTNFDVEKVFLKKGFEFQKLSQAGKTTIQSSQLTAVNAKAKDILKMPIASEKGITVYKEFPLEVYDEKSILRMINPAKRKTIKYDSESALIKAEYSTIPLDYQYELKEAYGLTATKVKEPINVKRVININKLSDPEYIKEVIKSLKKVYGQKPIKNLNIIKAPETTPFDTTQISNIGQSSQLKSTLTPVSNPIKTGIKANSILKGTQGFVEKLGFLIGLRPKQAVDVKTRERVKFDVLSKLNEKESSKFLESLDTGVRQKQRQAQQQRQDQALRLTQKLEQSLTKMPSLSIPALAPPPRPPKKFVPKGFNFDSELKILKLKKKLRKNKPEALGLFPDFTARALGLKPAETSLKDALKAIRKLQTGFEVRTGGRIKGYSPIQERNLLKGILK